jgi:PAS domain S-box-containing protein
MTWHAKYGEWTGTHRVRGGGAEGREPEGGVSRIGESLKTRAMDESPVGITVADATEPGMPLVYVNAAFGRITGYEPSYAVGRNCRFLQGEATREEPVARMRAAIESGVSVTVELRNYRRDGEMFWNEVTIAPLRDDERHITHYVGFQQDVSRRKRAELAATRYAREVERESAVQRRLLDRLDGVVGGVAGAIAEARTRDTLERDTAEGLAGTYDGAWVGRYDPGDGTVTPSAESGWTGPDGADTCSAESPEARNPVAEAAASALAGADDGVRVRPIEGGTVAAVSLQYGEATYGIVCVYVRDGNGFDSHERAVLAALGRVVATGLNTLESHRTLRDGERIDLRFAVGTDHPLVGLAAALGCGLEYVGSAADRDRPTDLFDVEGADPAALRAAASDEAVELHAVLDGEEGEAGCVAELSVADPAVRELLAEHGAELRGLRVTPDGAEFAVETARDSLARSLVDAVTERFGGELTRYREREGGGETPGADGPAARARSELTDRQHAALVRAHTGGFFEWPHGTTGDELAEAMGISRSTFHQHLRAAQRKVVGAVLDVSSADPN